LRLDVPFALLSAWWDNDGARAFYAKHVMARNRARGSFRVNARAYVMLARD
jgi:hypothetical protein